MEIFKLFGSILIQDEEAMKSLDNVDGKGKGVGTTLGNMVGTAAKWGAALAAGAGVAITGMFGLAEKASETASAINDMSSRTGLSTDLLQELKFASEQTGVSFESINGVVAKLTKSMDSADEGSKAAKEAFFELGVDVNDSNKKLRSMNDIFPETLEKLANMQDKTERNALAMKLFGKGATELVPLLNEGGGGIEALKQKAHDLGLVMNEEAIKAGDDFGDTWDAVKASLSAVGTQLGSVLLPIFGDFLKWVLDKIPVIREAMVPVFDKINEVIGIAFSWINDNILPVLGQLYQWAMVNMPTFKAIFNEVWGLVAEVVGAAWRIFSQDLLPILKALYNWVEPYFPTIGQVIKDAFDTVTWVVEGVISVFERVTSAIRTAVEWLTSWNDTPAASKEPSYSEPTYYSDYGWSEYADGTDFAVGGMALVGERGPELVKLPRGSKVYTASETRQMTGGPVLVVQGNLVVNNREDAEYMAQRLHQLGQSQLRAQGVTG